jgi:hypothetical protein
MGRYHIGLDRLYFNRTPPARFLLRRASPWAMPRRMMGILSGGGEAAVVLAGGVPSTARALYTVREWVSRTARQSAFKSGPSGARFRLLADEKFRKFLAQWPHGKKLENNVFRLAEAFAMACVEGVFGCPPGFDAESGQLSESARDSLRVLLSAFGIPENEAQAGLKTLEIELKRETPFRIRFFETICARILRRRPLILLPIIHASTEENPPLSIGPAWAWTALAGGTLSAESASGETFSGTIADFAKLFVAHNFD